MIPYHTKSLMNLSLPVSTCTEQVMKQVQACIKYWDSDTRFKLIAIELKVKNRTLKATNYEVISRS